MCAPGPHLVLGAYSVLVQARFGVLMFLLVYINAGALLDQHGFLYNFRRRVFSAQNQVKISSAIET